MPAILCQEQLHESSAPASWMPVLERLDLFLAASAEKASCDAPADLSDRLHAAHNSLLDASAAILEPGVLDDLTQADLARWFCRALLLQVRLKESVTAGDAVLDTAGSRTLSVYESDFYGSAENVELLKRRTAQRLGVSRAEIDAIEADVSDDLYDARIKQAVLRGLRDEFSLWPGSPGLRPGIERLFRTLCPGADVASDEIHLVATGTLIFLCLPYCGDQLTTDRYLRMPPERQHAVRDFLNRTQRFAPRRFANFPAFGFLSPNEVDGSLVDRLAARTGLSPDRVALEICRSVTLLPQAEIEKYLIHDVWGHGWQASMLEFEAMYEEMSHYADPLALSETADPVLPAPWTGRRPRFPRHGRSSFQDSFPKGPQGLVFDSDAFNSFVHAELSERLTVAMTAVLAEVMADVAEFKVTTLHPAGSDILPTSSGLEAFPAKLDLTLSDIPFYFSQATRVFRQWSERPARQQRTVAELISRGAQADQARTAVDQAVQCWKRLEETVYQPSVAWKQNPGGSLTINACARLALNFVGLHRAVLAVYERIGRLPTSDLPLKSWRDLLVIGASVFFEADRTRNLWRIDEYLTLRFVPLCERLAGLS